MIQGLAALCALETDPKMQWAEVLGGFPGIGDWYMVLCSVGIGSWDKVICAPVVCCLLTSLFSVQKSSGNLITFPIQEGLSFPFVVGFQQLCHDMPRYDFSCCHFLG